MSLLQTRQGIEGFIDMGPGGGEAGGEVVFAGTPEELAECEKSVTGRYLR